MKIHNLAHALALTAIVSLPSVAKAASITETFTLPSISGYSSESGTSFAEFNPALGTLNSSSLCLLVAGAVSVSAATVTYSFSAEVPTNSGPMPGSFVLTVPDFVTGTPSTQFTGNDFNSCTAPGSGQCIAEFRSDLLR
jgi:hypothetical protein